MCPPETTPPALRTHAIYADCHLVSGQIYSDLPGRFLAPSSAGNAYMLIVYDYDSNMILAEPMKSRSGAEYLAAYQKIHTLLTSRGLKPQMQKLDNEASTALQQFMHEEAIDYQLAPPHVHRTNAAERAICTFKNHFIAGLYSTDPDFPLHLWDRLLPQALLTLNLLRGSRINPRLSAQAQVHGAFDFNRTPLGPPGTRVLVHEKPTARATWAPHAVDGWYIGPAMHHYHCFRVWILDTKAERTCDTLTWFPSKVLMPTASSADAAIAAAQDLTQALLHPSPASPLAPLSNSQHAALQQLAEIFAATTTTHAETIFNPIAQQSSTVPTPTPPAPSAPPGFAPLLATMPCAPSLDTATPVLLPHVTFVPSTNPAPVPRVGGRDPQQRSSDTHYPNTTPEPVST